MQTFDLPWEIKQPATMLHVSHEITTKCQHLGGREDWIYGHILHLMLRKMNKVCGATVTVKNITNLYTLYICQLQIYSSIII